MRSSYKNKIDFSHILETILFIKNPTNIVEFGILDGFSLQCFAKKTNNNCTIQAFDLFGDFNGNHSNYTQIIELFKKYSNVKIKKGDFYKVVGDFQDNSIDIIHIDIANDGNTYQFAIDNYIQKLKKEGIMILEGGSQERDNIEWMNKYNKPKIKPIIETYSDTYDIYTLDQFPSITIIKNKV
jgi:predicted O-methyltransferase YrrM